MYATACILCKVQSHNRQVHKNVCQICAVPSRLVQPVDATAILVLSASLPQQLASHGVAIYVMQWLSITNISWCYCRYEIDKLTASQRLDLNLEKGRMRDELQALRDKANELEIKMDKETNSLKAAVEQTKNETIKYCLGMMLAFTTAGLGAARLVSH